MTPVELARFEAKVSPEPNTGCHLWTGAAIRQGYGYAVVGGKTRRAHRVAFEHFKQKVPEGLCVLHRCDQPACVNPDHLFLGTDKDNAVDRDRKGRGVGRATGRHSTGWANVERKGSAHRGAKLTRKLVEDVLAAYSGPLSRAGSKNGVVNPRSLTAVAMRFGVSPDTVRRIHLRQTWMDRQ